MKEIRTERLLLRAFQEADYDDLFEFLSQLKDDEFEGYPGISYENCREYLQQRMDSEEFYAVELADSGKVIGNIYCGERDFEAREVGYIINRNYRRTGYAEEALSAVIRNAFREGVHRVYAECDPRVRVIHKENSGVSDTRNRALEMAVGKYIQFADADDWLVPEATGMMVRAAEESGAGMVISDFYRVVGNRISHKGSIDEEGLITRLQFAEYMERSPADYYYGVLWNKLFRRETIETHRIRMDENLRW